MADPFYYGKEYCFFYLKTGACQYRDNCSRIHAHPPISNALVLPNMYQCPDLDPTKLQEHFEDFYEDIFEELSHFGDIKSLSVCNNLVDHMIGNVYVVFKEDYQADAALQAFRTRAYCGRPIVVDFLPVRDVRFVACKQFVEDRCHRGDFCNFMHERVIGRGLWKKLFGSCRRDYSGGRYCSPRRERSPVRDGSEERRARIEMWNRERDERR